MPNCPICTILERPLQNLLSVEAYNPTIQEVIDRYGQFHLCWELQVMTDSQVIVHGRPAILVNLLRENRQLNKLTSQLYEVGKCQIMEQLDEECIKFSKTMTGRIRYLILMMVELNLSPADIKKEAHMTIKNFLVSTFHRTGDKFKELTEFVRSTVVDVAHSYNC